MHATLAVLRALMAAAVLCVGGCALSRVPAGPTCSSDDFVVDARFEAGSFHDCVFSEPDSVVVRIRPDDERNSFPSPWYALRVSPRQAGQVELTLDFGNQQARYWPKISIDQRNWRALDPGLVRRSADGRRLEVTLDVPDAPVLLAAQELVATAWYKDWIRALAAREGVRLQTIGRSVLGSPIYAVKTADRAEVVYLIGRQHPPEVTGAIAMRSFVETVLSDSDLAHRFRQRFMVVMLPLMNPDGVARGHWRNNMNGVDLNRDWGPFTQPETRSVATLMRDFDALGHTPRLMLDFHSTKRNLFYTQRPEDSAVAFDFARRWLDRARVRLPDFEFAHEATPRSDRANTKNYFFGRYGVPAITYELGDETDRREIAESAPVFAEEMMRLLLGEP